MSDASTERVDERDTVGAASEVCAAEGADLSALWWEKQRTTGLVRHDPRLLVLHGVEEVCGRYEWGTVFYSKAREDYKTRVGSLPEKRAATFDLDLMSRLLFARTGGLNVAANPNSLAPGHLVVWPEEKRARLTLRDLSDVSRLARAQKELTFIHNMERAAASIVDWAHFQAYPWEFPLSRAGMCETVCESAHLRVSRLAETYPAYALSVEAGDAEKLAAWLFGMLRRASSGTGEGQQGGIPCNIVWRGARAWLIPRSLAQTELAATYVGALEMGGLFCLPNADSLRQYLPDALGAEVRGASIADEPHTRAYFEQAARDAAAEFFTGDDETTT
ncbi:MAG TPA: hypothetical protein VF656_20885 [Pyrinomonadaceae bacterium]